MVANNHILVDDEIRKYLEDSREYPRETFNDILRRLLKNKSNKIGRLYK